VAGRGTSFIISLPQAQLADVPKDYLSEKIFEFA